MSEKVTIEHGNEFINRIKELKWDDVKTCKNITDLYVNFGAFTNIRGLFKMHCG